MSTDSILSCQATTPRSQGLTALSTYALTCLLFVFAAMQEFAFILFAMRRFKASNGGEEEQNSTISHERKSELFVVTQLRRENHPISEGEKAEKKAATYCIRNQSELEKLCYQTDQRAFVLFAVAFTVFHIVYAVCYSK